MPAETKGDQWYLEHTVGHNKFYEVTIKSSDDPKSKPYLIVTRHGRIGVNGRVLEFDRADTIEKARYIAQELVRTKLDKGYKQVKYTKPEAPSPTKKKDTSIEMNRFGKIDWE